jgi:hypothetical protein
MGQPVLGLVGRAKDAIEGHLCFQTHGRAPKNYQARNDEARFATKTRKLGTSLFQSIFVLS